MKLIMSSKYIFKYPYYITIDGKIYSQKTKKILSTHLDKNGYEKVRLICQDKRHTFSVHRLVLETYEPVNNMQDLQVNHIDGNKTNNSLNNLEWTTCKENIAHACRLNLRHCQLGEENNATNLSNQDVLQIIQLLLTSNYTQKDIGNKFQVSEDVIGAIKNKKNWTHLTKDIVFN